MRSLTVFIFIFSLLYYPAMAVQFYNPPRAKPQLPDYSQFRKWKEGFINSSTNYGLDKNFVRQQLKNTKPSRTVIRLDRKQPEGSISFARYALKTLTKQMINKGINKYLEHRPMLEKIGREFGVQPQYMVALWGKETHYGGYTGDFDIVDSLATLAAEGRRREFFTSELINALKILHQGHISRKTFKGSWAGAFGHCQFMPSSFYKYGYDYDKDSKIDLFNSRADIFASIANYLRQEGWNHLYSWGTEAAIKPDMASKIYNKGNKFNRLDYHKLEYWNKQGVFIGNLAKQKIGKNDIAIVQPYEDKHYKAFLITPNYNILMHWNKSIYFATTVGKLADLIESGINKNKN